MLSEEIRLFSERYAEYKREKEVTSESTVEKIHVDEIAAKVAVFYEKVRNIIEYRDVNLLRKSAIERILRRRVFLKDFNEDFAEPLVKELIRGGHLPNDAVPETKIADIREIINNLLVLLKLEGSSGGKTKSEVSEWFVEMSVSRIEEELFPSPEVALLSEMMYDVIKGHLTLKNIPLSEDDANLQLFVAVQRALFRPDKNQLQYLLLKIMHPNWGKFSEKELEAAAGSLGTLKKTIEDILKNPCSSYFLKVCNREKIVFQLVGDLVFDKVPFDEDFASSLKLRYDRRYTKIKQQLRRLAFLSVLSFLISKLLVALAIEIPIDNYFYNGFRISSLIINIGFSPLLMLIIVAFVKLPSKKNFALVETAAKQVVSNDPERTYLISAPKKKSWLANALVYFAYAAVLYLILRYITKWLLVLHFSPASIVIFLLFTSMVTATGVKIKNRAREMSFEKEKTSIWGFIVDLVTVPFMTIGRWTIAGLSKFNVLVIAFDFLIELPFQFLIEFLENFRGYIREKKEEIR